MRDVMRGDFTLLDGDMNDLMPAGAVTRRVDVRGGGLHARIGLDAGALQFNARPFEAQMPGVRRAPEREIVLVCRTGARACSA